MINGYIFYLNKSIDRARRNSEKIRKNLHDLLEKGSGSNLSTVIIAATGTNLNELTDSIDEIEEVFKILSVENNNSNNENKTLQSHEKSALIMEINNWEFIGNHELSSILSRDYAELERLLEVSAYKSAMIMAGSILEAVLTALLSKKLQSADDIFSGRYGKPKPIESWTLEQLVYVSSELGILDYDSKGHADLLRSYRILVHPMVEHKRKTIIDKDMASILLLMLKRTLRTIIEKS